MPSGEKLTFNLNHIKHIRERMKVLPTISITGALAFLFVAELFAESQFSFCERLGIGHSVTTKKESELQMLNSKLGDVQKRLEAVQENLLSKQGESQGEVKEKLEAAREVLTLISKEVQAVRNEEISERLSQQEKTQGEIKEKLDEAIRGNAEINACTQKISDAANALVEGRNDFASLVRSLLEKQELTTRAASDAEKLFQQAAEKGEVDAAVQYALNAINHDASNLDYYRHLANLAEKVENEDTLEQIQGVVQLAFYRTDVRYSAEISEMDKKIGDRLAALKEEHQGQEQPPLSPEEERRLETEQAFGAIHEAITNYVKLADQNIRERKLMEAGACLQMIQPYFVQMMSLDASQLSEGNLDMRRKDEEKIGDLRTKLMEKRVEICDAIFSEEEEMVKWSNIPVEENFSVGYNYAVAILQEEGLNYRAEKGRICAQIPLESSFGKYTIQMQRKTRLMKILEILLTYASSEDLVKKQQELTKEIAVASLERMREYQTWAVRQCQSAQNKWDDKLRVNDEYARKVIKGDLMQIEPNLLRQEVSELFYGILGKYRAKFEGKDIADLVTELATSDKKKITEF